jgi:hypothetical protein
LHDQCRMQQGGSARDHHNQQQQQHVADGAATSWIGAAGSYDGAGSCIRGSAMHHPLVGGGTSGSSSRMSAGGIARSPPCGSDDDEEYYQIRAGHVSRSEGGAQSGRCSRSRQLMLQQQLQQAKAAAAAAARAAAMVVNLPLPKGSPVHPIFGRAAPAAAAVLGSLQQGSAAGAGTQV